LRIDSEPLFKALGVKKDERADRNKKRKEKTIFRNGRCIHRRYCCIDGHML
jgi:hypothetical protein